MSPRRIQHKTKPKTNPAPASSVDSSGCELGHSNEVPEFVPFALYSAKRTQQILELTARQLYELERTGQITSIRICGEKRFIAEDLHILVATYKQIASKRNAHERKSNNHSPETP
jgi:hypothetical protein